MSVILALGKLRQEDQEFEALSQNFFSFLSTNIIEHIIHAGLGIQQETNWHTYGLFSNGTDRK
jgi:hypothetical protein